MIGAPELVVFGLIMAGLAIAVLVIVRYAVGSKRVPSGMVPCRLCHKAISPRAPSCPYCGEPRT